VANETVKVNLLLLDSFEKSFLADSYGTCSSGFTGDLAALGADDGDLPIALDGVG
jgi:hypothetical protein